MADIKSQLNSAAMKYKGGPLTKEDMVYTKEKFGDQVQATVQLNFVDGMQFAGELAADEKEAQKNAASQALAYLQEQAPSVSAASAPKKNNNKRKAPAADAGGLIPAGKGAGKNAMYQQAMDMVAAMMSGGGWGGIVHPANGGDQSKMTLSQWVSKQAGKLATKDEIVYTTEEVEGAKPPQFVSTVVLLTIDADKSYQGEAKPSKKAAEVAAAAAALQENGVGPAQPAMKKAKKGAGKSAKPEGRACKWCEQGECWTHGQIEKPVAEQTEKPAKAAVPAKVIKATTTAAATPVVKKVVKKGKA